MKTYKTWLTHNKKTNDVHRHNEYGDEPDWIGTINYGDGGSRWFTMYGDNRTLNVSELQQILDFF